MNGKKKEEKNNFNNVKILCFESNDKKRLIKEAIEINKNNKATTNFKSNTFNISDTFAPINDYISRLTT